MKILERLREMYGKNNTAFVEKNFTASVRCEVLGLDSFL